MTRVSPHGHGFKTQQDHSFYKVFNFSCFLQNFPIPYQHVCWSTNTSNALAQLVPGLLLVLSATYPLKGHGFKTQQDHFIHSFFTNFNIFIVFSSNFNNFFNQSKLLILRWFFAHLSFNIYILWLCQKNPKIFSSD